MILPFRFTLVDKVLRYGGCKTGEASLGVLRGASTRSPTKPSVRCTMLCPFSLRLAKPHERSLVAGAPEILMAAAIDKRWKRRRERLWPWLLLHVRCVRVPAIVADNGGYDSAELVTQLQAAHAAGNKSYGLDMYNGTIGVHEGNGVRESFESKASART
jgi:T-complex protein 1 subunit beta